MKPKTRSYILHAWINPRELEIVKHMAAQDGFSLSEALRECIREEAKRRGIWRPESQEA